jgi:hypothetical protein
MDIETTKYVNQQQQQPPTTNLYMNNQNLEYEQLHIYLQLTFTDSILSAIPGAYK